MTHKAKKSRAKKAKAKRRPPNKGRTSRPSTLAPGQAQRILDKLLLLEKVIPQHDVVQVLHDTGCIDSRCCTLTFEVTCWLVLAMGILTDLPIRQVFKAARRLYPG